LRLRTRHLPVTFRLFVTTALISHTTTTATVTRVHPVAPPLHPHRFTLRSLGRAVYALPHTVAFTLPALRLPAPRLRLVRSRLMRTGLPLDCTIRFHTRRGSHHRMAVLPVVRYPVLPVTRFVLPTVRYALPDIPRGPRLPVATHISGYVHTHVRGCPPHTILRLRSCDCLLWIHYCTPTTRLQVTYRWFCWIHVLDCNTYYHHSFGRFPHLPYRRYTPRLFEHLQLHTCGYARSYVGWVTGAHYAHVHHGITLPDCLRGLFGYYLLLPYVYVATQFDYALRLHYGCTTHILRTCYTLPIPRLFYGLLPVTAYDTWTAHGLHLQDTAHFTTDCRALLLTYGCTAARYHTIRLAVYSSLLPGCFYRVYTPPSCGYTHTTLHYVTFTHTLRHRYVPAPHVPFTCHGPTGTFVVHFVPTPVTLPVSQRSPTLQHAFPVLMPTPVLPCVYYALQLHHTTLLVYVPARYGPYRVTGLPRYVATRFPDTFYVICAYTTLFDFPVYVLGYSTYHRTPHTRSHHLCRLVPHLRYVTGTFVACSLLHCRF